ncbi:type II secretion system F family protein [Rubrivivax rivuli]|uniref:Type II secretion system F family protein n=1 Tax=Rubrivivax rivuli TaxID=1862385 RepID=A0A437RCC5_9BURK|nr:type II secretion system F family protein [Rubrivivax rivuli]RVU44436.1 type II secretion system F family protein [Rubrivivax rivuli]
MSTWAWRGRNRRGEQISGVIEADSPAAVADQLLAGGVTPVQIDPGHTPGAGPATPRSVWQVLGSSPVTGEDVLLFARQMHTLQKAGVPILRALAGLQASTQKPALVALLADVRASLDQGRELATALARHPSVFDNFFIAMVRVGEMTGRLTESFQRLAQHVEFELDVRARVKQALRYPTMVVGAIVVAMVIVNIFVIPAFAGVFANYKVELPLMTRVLLGVSAFTVAWWELLLAAAVAALWGVRAVLATPAGRYRWDRLKLRLPVVGSIVLKATLGRFARSFAIAYGSGVPISRAMTVVAQTANNAYMAERIEQMRDGIERGETLSRCAAAAGIFTPVVLQMVAVGEETGALDTLLLEVAEMYERETDYAIKGLSAHIEPLLLAVIGSMVLVLALGVFLPLWDLGQAARAGA